jgi:hypothetical protein
LRSGAARIGNGKHGLIRGIRFDAELQIHGNTEFINYLGHHLAQGPDILASEIENLGAGYFVVVPHRCSQDAARDIVHARMIPDLIARRQSKRLVLDGAAQKRGKETGAKIAFTREREWANDS